jgi:hypothetical protein
MLELGSELLIRKVCHDLSLYVILSKVIFHQFLEEVQAIKIHSSNLRSHLLMNLPGSLSSRSLSSRILMEGVGPKLP